MNILILASLYPPEVRSAANIMFELSESLKERGHTVSVITSTPATDKSSFKFITREKQNSVNVIRVNALPIHATTLPALIRGTGQLINCLLFAYAGLSVKKVDVIIAYSPPLPSGITATITGYFRKAPFILNVQDIVPQYAIDLGMLKNRVIIKVLKHLEHYLYEKARFIVVHSKGNRDYLIKENVPHNKAVIIHNWVDTESIKPADKNNEFRKTYNLNNRFVMLFAGMLAFAQDLDTLLESAFLLKKHYKEILFLIVGDGVEKERLTEKAREMNLTNVRFLPFVSKEKYPEVVAACDACIATISKKITSPVVPSKIMGYMAAGRPIILGMPQTGDAALIVKEANCGTCVEPGNAEKLAETIAELYSNKKMCKQYSINAREYALKHFERQISISRYDDLLKQI